MTHRSKWQSLATEAINPPSLAIDKLPADEIVELMIGEDRKMLAAVQREKSRIATGVDLIATALRKGGRVVFVGAGTSGRLGILESAEMPPTFSTDPALVQAIIAGGKGAILRAKEGVEDNYEEGARAITRLGPTRKDVVIGVSAIGKTYGNLMVDVQTGSEKLKDRARRIVNIVTGLEYEDADRLLNRAHWNVKAAIVMQKTAVPYVKALSRLRRAHDSMREALGEDIEPRLRELLDGHQIEDAASRSK